MLLKVIHYIMKNNIYKTIKNTIDRIELDPEKYRHTFVNPDKDFTRDRKQTLSSVVRTGLLRSGSTQNQDLRLVYGVGDDRPSASAYIQQRDKLAGSFYRLLFDNMQEEKDFTLIKGRYLLAACDGSDINICPNADDGSSLVRLSNNPHGKVCNQVHLNCLVAVPDGYFLEYEIQDHRDENETGACCDMMRRLSGRMRDTPVIVTADRGYEGYFPMMDVAALGQYFCFRLKDIDSSSISGRYRHLCDEDGCFDAVITRKYTRRMDVYNRPEIFGGEYVYVGNGAKNYNHHVPRTNGMRGKGGCLHIPVTYYEFTFRIVRLRISDGCYEVLATNLPAEEFSADDLMDVYQLRWGVETSYRFLKYCDHVSFSNTRKKSAAMGEIVLAMIFHNICVSVMIDASRRMRRIKRREKAKLFKVSYSDLSKTVRLFLAGRDPTITPRKIVKELDRTIQAVRNGRVFSRILNHHSFLPFVYRAA